MELEISRLRAQAERQASAGGTDKEQIAALEDKLARAEQAAMKATRELGDVKRNLERATERAVKEGGARTSAGTKARTLEKEVEGLNAEKADLEKKVEALDKKVAALGTLHKEHEARAQTLRREKERAELENARLRKRRKGKGKKEGEDDEKDEDEEEEDDDDDDDSDDNDDDSISKLEDEERARMSKKIRALESEVYDLRRGIWHQRRKEMEFGGAGGADAADPTSPGFTNIDLGGGGGGLTSPTMSAKKTGHGRGGFGDFFASGINALAGVGNNGDEASSSSNNKIGGGGGGGGDDAGFLDDEDFEFDEEAFRRAQEEEGRRRLERIRDIKRGLKNWEGWRLDLVESRRGAGFYGGGEVFEV